MSLLIIDASVAIKWFLDENGSECAQALFESEGPFIAPDLVIVTGDIDCFDDLFPSRELVSDATEISCNLDHPVYDCFYLALARKFGAPLITADWKLVTRVTRASLNIDVRALIPMN